MAKNLKCVNKALGGKPGNVEIEINFENISPALFKTEEKTKPKDVIESSNNEYRLSRLDQYRPDFWH